MSPGHRRLLKFGFIWKTSKTKSNRERENLFLKGQTSNRIRFRVGGHLRLVKVREKRSSSSSFQWHIRSRLLPSPLKQKRRIHSFQKLKVTFCVSCVCSVVPRDLSNNQISEIAPDAFQGLRALNSLWVTTTCESVCVTEALHGLYVWSSE